MVFHGLPWSPIPPFPFPHPSSYFPLLFPQNRTLCGLFQPGLPFRHNPVAVPRRSSAAVAVEPNSGTGGERLSAASERSEEALTIQAWKKGPKASNIEVFKLNVSSSIDPDGLDRAVMDLLQAFRD